MARGCALTQVIGVAVADSIEAARAAAEAVAEDEEVLEEGEVVAPVAAPAAVVAPDAAPPAAAPGEAVGAEGSDASRSHPPTPKRKDRPEDASMDDSLMPPRASPRAEHVAEQEIAGGGSQLDRELCNLGEQDSLC